MSLIYPDINDFFTAIGAIVYFPARWIPRNKESWRGALMFCVICAWINGWVNNEADDLRRRRAHYDVIVMTRVDDSWTVCIVVFYSCSKR